MRAGTPRRNWAAGSRSTSPRGTATPGAVRTFVARVISSEPGSPVLSIGDQIPQVDPAVQAEVLSPLGFFLVRRADMTFPADRAIPDDPPAVLPPMRNLAASDEEAIAQLMARALRRQSDRNGHCSAGRGDPLEDARDGAHMFLGRVWASGFPSASFGVEENGRLIAATVVNDFHGPLLTEVMVEPAATPGDWRRG